jgi:hypothetical protein
MKKCQASAPLQGLFKILSALLVLIVLVINEFNVLKTNRKINKLDMIISLEY